MSQPSARVLHIIPVLSLGGAARALFSLCKYRGAGFVHEVISLQPPDARAVALARDAGLFVHAPQDSTALSALVGAVDIVHVHFWNDPSLYEWLTQARPLARIVAWLHVNALEPPHCITPGLIAASDHVVASGETTLGIDAFAEVPPDRRHLVIPGADFDRLSRASPVSHEFTVGYVGTLSFAKLRRDYIALHTGLDMPKCRVIVYGEGRDAGTLKREASASAVPDRFVFAGYAHDPGVAFATMDVFGYPLAHDNYGTGELVVQEAMYAGVPPVVLPFGGAAHRIIDGETGVIARTAQDYRDAIRRLHDDPAERLRLGRNASMAARRDFSALTMTRKFEALYAQMMQAPKREAANPDARRHAMSGAHLLIQSLVRAGVDFASSLASADEAAREAEARIARASTGLFEVLQQYRRHFPDDPHLAMWSGLVLMGAGRTALATAELGHAVRLGCDHWRAQWYLAQAAARAGAVGVASIALAAARAAAPVGISLE